MMTLRNGICCRNTYVHDPEKPRGGHLLISLQVTWDDKSLFVNGERIMIFSGEVHPFRYAIP